MQNEFDTIHSGGTEVAAPACPRCGREFDPDAVLCCHCGYHRELGYTLETDVTDAVPWERPHAKPVSDGGSHVYLTPFLTFIVACGVLVGFGLMFEGPAAAVGSLIGLAVGVPVALVAYLICAVAWIGHDAPIPLTILRLAAVYAVADAVAAFLPGVLLTWSLAILVTVIMLMHFLELDVTDAAAVATLTILLKILLVVGLLATVVG